MPRSRSYVKRTKAYLTKEERAEIKYLVVHRRPDHGQIPDKVIDRSYNRKLNKRIEEKAFAFKIKENPHRIMELVDWLRQYIKRNLPDYCDRLK